MSICSAVSGHRGSVRPEQGERPCKLLPQELRSASQHQAPPLPQGLWASLLYLEDDVKEVLASHDKEVADKRMQS